MYASIKRSVSSTTNGAFRKNDCFLDFEKLPWVEWIDLQPMSNRQKSYMQLLYPILLQEINIAKPSSLMQFLIGKGVLFWQDVVVIKQNRQTDLEMNGPFLRIMATRGSRGFEALVDGLRTRRGAWQGYLADMLEMNFHPQTLRDMLDIYKIVCHDLAKVMSVGWSALPRALGVKPKVIEKCRRQNRLIVNQALHSLLEWSGMRTDKEQMLSELLSALNVINRRDIADGIVLLLQVVKGIQVSKGRRTNSEEDVYNEAESGLATEETEEDIFAMSRSVSQQSEIPQQSLSPRRVSLKDGRRIRRHLQSADSGFVSPVPSSARATNYSRSSTARKHRSKSPKSARSRVQNTYPKRLSLRDMPTPDAYNRMQIGNVYNYNISPRGKKNVWEGRKPSILQMDYLVHPVQDNMFMDYLVYQ